MNRSCVVFKLGIQQYEKVWKYQKALVELINHNRKHLPIESQYDCILLTQHSSIYTLGKRANIDNLKFNTSTNDIEKHQVCIVERGGEVTWHGPGQMIAYPIIDLQCHKKDLHWYVRSIEESVINTLSKLNITNSSRSDINSGVWIDNNKISAVGIACSRWITYHGISINVNPNMSYFKKIIPCGINIPNVGVCSIVDNLPSNESVTVSAVEDIWLSQVICQFKLNVLHKSSISLTSQFAVHDQNIDDILFLDSILEKFPDIASEKLNMVESHAH